MTELTHVFGMLCYTVLALIALWGAFCVVLVWMRVAKKRFRSEAAQDEFLDQLDAAMAKGDFDGALDQCDGDQRAISQLAVLAIHNRDIGPAKIRQLLIDRFQRDVLADLEYRLSWINTVIKSAPMVGLLGTVIGMMGAFAKLGVQGVEGSVKTETLAQDIYLALITTAIGLAIAIPLIFCTASINVRIRKLEDLVAVGLARFLNSFRSATGHDAEKEKR